MVISSIRPLDDVPMLQKTYSKAYINAEMMQILDVWHITLQ